MDSQKKNKVVEKKCQTSLDVEKNLTHFFLEPFKTTKCAMLKKNINGSLEMEKNSINILQKIRKKQHTSFCL